MKKISFFIILVILGLTKVQAQEATPVSTTPLYKISQGETLHNFPANAHSLEQTTWVLNSPDGKTLNCQGKNDTLIEFDFADSNNHFTP